MRKIFSLLVILGMLFIISCGKEEPATTISAAVIEEIESEEERENITTVRLCHDTDNGIVRWVNGSIFGYYPTAERFEFNDFCFNNDILIEYYCENEMPHNMTFVCEHGCGDNHCQ